MSSGLRIAALSPAIALSLFSLTVSAQCLEAKFVAQNGDLLISNVDLQGARALHYGPQAAHIFDETPGGWIETELHTADGTFDPYGPVALDGNTAVIGSPRASFGDGRVYVFEKGPGGWTETILQQPGPPVLDFGNAVGILGDLLVVGSPRAGNEMWGHTYVFRRNAGAWTFESELTPSVLFSYEAFFGRAIGIGHDFVAVGGPGLSQGVPFTGVGTVNIFAKGPAGWALVDEIFPLPFAPSTGVCGDGIAVHGNRILATHGDSMGWGAVLFDRNDAGTSDPLDDQWIQTTNFSVPSTGSVPPAVGLGDGIAVIATQTPQQYWIYVETTTVGWVQTGPYPGGPAAPGWPTAVDLDGGRFALGDGLMGLSPRRASLAYRTGMAGIAYYTMDIPVLGGTWTGKVSAPAGAITYVAYGMGGPTPPISTVFGEILCLPPYAPINFAAGTHTFNIPNECSFATATLATQGGYIDGAGVTLSNAIDLLPGY